MTFRNTFISISIVIVMAAALCLPGCNSVKKEPPPPLPPPEVQVTIHEDTEAVWSEISMSYHGKRYDGTENIPDTKWASIKLNSIEEVQKYRKQAEFLLLRLIEIEEKMRSKEPKKELSDENGGAL